MRLPIHSSNSCTHSITILDLKPHLIIFWIILLRLYSPLMFGVLHYGFSLFFLFLYIYFCFSMLLDCYSHKHTICIRIVWCVEGISTLNILFYFRCHQFIIFSKKNCSLHLFYCLASDVCVCVCVSTRAGKQK